MEDLELPPMTTQLQTQTSIENAHDERTEIHNENVFQVAELKKALDKHCIDNIKSAKLTDDKLELLMPLVKLITPLQQMVDEKRASVIMAAKFMKIIGVVGAILGILYGVVQLGKEFFINK